MPTGEVKNVMAVEDAVLQANSRLLLLYPLMTTAAVAVIIASLTAVAAITGPPVMYKFVIMSLQSNRLADDRIYVSLERRMKCGVGKCGHCQINGVYCCQDGPVFNYAEIKPLEEAL
jgi:NAD(P)H-flavin reductase